jgi:hypothetical protein
MKKNGLLYKKREKWVSIVEDWFLELVSDGESCEKRRCYIEANSLLLSGYEDAI